MFWLSQLYILAAVFYLVLGFYAFKRNTKGDVNRLFGLTTVTLAIYALSYALMMNAADPVEASVWYRVSHIGKGLYAALILHFTFMITFPELLKRRVYVPFLIYAIPLFFTVSGVFHRPPLQMFYPTRFGWAFQFRPQDLKISILPLLDVCYHLSYLVLIVVFLFRTKERTKQNMAVILLLTGFSSQVLNVAMQVMFLRGEWTILIPEPLILLIWAGGIGVAILRYHLMTLTPDIAVKEIFSSVTDGLALLNTGFYIGQTNESLVKMTGKDSKLLIGERFCNLFIESDRINEALTKIESKGDREQLDDMHLFSVNSDPLLCDLSISPLKRAFRDIGGYLVTVYDVRQRRLYEREVEFRKAAENGQRALVDELTFLTQTAIELIEVSDKEEFYKYVADKLRGLAGGKKTLVGITIFDNDAGTFRLKAFSGKSDLMRSMEKKLNRSPFDASFNIDYDMAWEMAKTPFYKVRDFYDFTFRSVPKAICQRIQKILGLKDILTVGLVQNDQIYGFASFIIREDIKITNTYDILAFLNQAATVLQKKIAEEKREEVRENMRYLMQTSMELVEFTPEMDIYQYIADKLSDILKDLDPIVEIITQDPESESAVIRSISGVRKKDWKAGLKKSDIMGLSLSMNSEIYDRLSEEDIVRVENMEEMIHNPAVKKVSNKMKKLFNIEARYFLGFNWGNQTFALALVSIRNNHPFVKKDFVRTFMRQIAIYLQRRVVEEALRRSESRFRLIAEHSPTAIVIIQDGILVYANRVFYKLTGYNEIAVNGWRPYAFIKLINPAERIRFLKEIRKGYRPESLHIQFKGVSRSGETIWLELYSRKIIYSGVPAYFVTLIDVSERILKEEMHRRQRNYRELETRMWRIAADKAIKSENELIDRLFEAVGSVVKPAHIVIAKIDSEGHYEAYRNWGESVDLTMPKDIKIPPRFLDDFETQQYKVLTFDEIKEAIDSETTDTSFLKVLKEIYRKNRIETSIVYPYRIGEKVEGLVSFDWENDVENYFNDEDIQIGVEMAKILSLVLLQIRTKGIEVREQFIRELRLEIWKLTLDSDLFDETELIRRLFSLAGESLKPSRICLNLLATGSHEVVVEHQWVNKGFEPVEKTKRLPLKVWMLFSNFRYLLIDSSGMESFLETSKEIKQNQKSIQDMLERDTIASVLILPYRIVGDLAGFITIEWCVNRERTWTESEIFLGLDIVEILAASVYRMRAAKQILESQQQLQGIIENSSAMISLKDTTGKYVFANKNFLENFMIDEEQLQQITDAKLFGYQSAERILADTKKVFREIATIPFEETIIVRGERKFFIGIMFPLVDKHGAPYSVCSMYYDISERKYIESVMAVQRDFAFQVSSANRMHDAMNLLLEVMMKISPIDAGMILAEASENSFAILTHRNLSDDFVEHYRKYFSKGGVDKRVLAGHSLYKTVREIQPKNRKVFTQEGFEYVLYVPILHEKKTILILALSSHRNAAMNDSERQAIETICAQMGGVAARIIAESKMYDYMDKLKSSNESLQQFAYIASHDLKEPLRMVAGFIGLIDKRLKERNLSDSEIDEFMSFAQDGVKRMDKLILALLRFSRVETSARPYGAVDCGEVLTEVVQDLKVAIEESGAKINVSRMPKIQADREQIARVFQNLISNAIKFRVPGVKPVVTVSSEIEGNSYRFSVKDNGIGIDPEFKDKVFQIFQRLHSRFEYEGTGIGLSISKRIVERHGGKIWFESEPGKGAVFYFTIPRSDYL